MYFYTILVALLVLGISMADHHEEEHDAGAHYQFAYGVHDPHTHDIKSQHEHRDGHNVKGGYAMKEADGTQRVVEYVSDHKGGFQAVVKRIGQAQHPAHYGKHGHGGHGGVGGTSWVGVTHYGYKH